jgi:phage gp36-like protein
LQNYLDKIEELNPGVLADAIAAVSAEMDDVLRTLYVLPLATVPETLKRISAVLAAHRCVGAITSLMSSEAQTENEWIFLQGEAKQARKDLADIRDGKINLELERLGADQAKPEGIRVLTRRRMFDADTWGKF